MEMNNNNANRSCDPFIRRCRLRIGAGILAVLLGAQLSVLLLPGNRNRADSGRNPADCAKQKLFKESGANEETKNPGNG